MKTLIADNRQRVRLPQAKPGQVFAYEPNSDGTITLIPVVAKPSPKRIMGKMVNKRGRLFLEIPQGYSFDPEAIGEAVMEERESRS